ncbi:MAG TPA: DinB family protein [Candidatus Dormibacteraeota bacterium]|nr:DinB family protein [Candidatus Dormibacteraeota bacterium]
MKHLRTFCLLALVCFATAAFAQAAKTAAPAATPNAQAKKTAPPTIASAVDQQISIIEREFVGAAEAMPDDKFNFAPGTLNIPNSEYKGVKTFAEEVRHVAATNYILWGAITGDKSPIESKEDNGPSSLTTKADIVKYLKDSFALGHKAANSITAENAAAQVPSPFGQGQTTKLFCATFAVAHAFDHYGQMVEYLRMNGIIPPASRGGN